MHRGGQKLIGWDEKWHLPGRQEAPQRQDARHRLRLGPRMEQQAGGWHGRVLFEPDGSVSSSASVPTRRVSETAYCQIAADELGMRYEDVVHEAA